MKIAFILPSLVNKGPIVVAYNIVKHIKDKVDLIDIYYFDETDSSLNFDGNIYHIKKSDLIDFDKYDVIHSHTIRADNYLFKARNKIHKAKIVSTIHQDTFVSFSIQYNTVLSFILTSYWCYIHRSFDGVIAISNELKDKYNGLLSNKITTIYNGCSIGDSSTDTKIEDSILKLRSENYKIIGSYAFITKRKGLSQVINVLNLLTDYALVIIGEGPELENLKKSVDKLNLSDRVLFVPYMNAPYSYLAYFDIYAMPSYSEGFGLSMVEAALAKKSIVCSNIPSFHELFTPSEVSFFDLDNSDSLIQSIKLANGERDVRGELAYCKANKLFTAEIMAHNHFLYYKNVLNN
jgi:glycosyltransferase involved in cell wall biosynthesis